MRIRRIGVAIGVFALCTSASAAPSEVVFRLKPRVDMAALARSVTDPGSPRFQKPYTPDEIRRLAGSTDSELSALLAELSRVGFTHLRTSRTHLFIFAQGFAGSGNALRLLKLSARSQIASFAGDSTGPKFHPMDRVESSPTPEVSTAALQHLYNFDRLYAKGITGQGQDIAIATFDGFDLQEIQSYLKTNGIAAQVDGRAVGGALQANPDSALETESDAELAASIAPGARIHVFAAAQNDLVGEIELFSAILDDGRSEVVDFGWALCESETDSKHQSDMDQLYGQAVGQAVNIFVASSAEGPCPGTKSNASWPSVNPLVTSVGGSVTRWNGTSTTEIPWTGSPGALSAVYGRPTWQDVGPTFTMRTYPDVAFNAVGEKVLAGGRWLPVDGTGIAAAQWAGYLSLVNDARGNLGQLWTLNPIMYQFTPQQIQSGFVNLGPSEGTAAWHLGTGWGRPVGDALFALLDQ